MKKNYVILFFFLISSVLLGLVILIFLSFGLNYKIYDDTGLGILTIDESDLSVEEPPEINKVKPPPPPPPAPEFIEIVEDEQVVLLTYKCGNSVPIEEPLNQCVNSFSKYDNQSLAIEICNCAVVKVASNVTLEQFTNDSMSAIKLSNSSEDMYQNIFFLEYVTKSVENCLLENPHFNNIFGNYVTEEQIKSYAKTHHMLYKNDLPREQYNSLYKQINLELAFECIIRKLYEEYSRNELMNPNDELSNRYIEIEVECFEKFRKN